MNVKAGAHLWDRHPHVRSHSDLTFGEQAADRMRNGFGSWAFVFVFMAILAGWMVLNSAILAGGAFDKYPYILLNLCLSCLAALQGALILIAAKRADRVAAEAALHHYEDTKRIKDLQDQQMTILEEIRQLRAAVNDQP